MSDPNRNPPFSGTAGPPVDSIDMATEFDPATQATPAPTDDLRVYLIVRDRAQPRVIDVADGMTVLFGRAPEAAVRVDDTRASRRHAELKRNGRELFVVDLGSRNGTKINGERLMGETKPVRGGDVIRVGGVETIVAVSEGAAVAPGAAPVGGRLDAELRRIAENPAGRATLVRITVDLEQEDVLKSLTATLGAMALMEERDDGDYAALLEESDPAAVERVLTQLRGTPGVQIGTARFPEQGRTAEDLWARLRAGALEPAVTGAREGVVVADPAMVEVFDLARKLAAVPTTVLILGETGVGKEVIAEQIHRWSPRSAAPFVRLNCASLPETLLESELFGHERGAFTGAVSRKIGYLEAAQGGTLLLDEIGELPLTAQVKLLNVLENRVVRRLGATREYPVDVRVIAATHRDMDAEVAASRFREDLYYRLSAFKLLIPPLRERQAEIALLAEMFARDASRRAGRPAPAIDASALAAIARHPWPGNVRELRNAMEHAVVLADAGHISAQHLPTSVRRRDMTSSPNAAGGSVRDKIADLERRTIEEALAAEGGNQTRAARRLGLSRRALIYKMEKYAVRR